MGWVNLDGVSLESAMAYGSIVLVALDGRPMASPAKMLLQVAGAEQPYAWAASQSSGLQNLTHRGTLPLMVRNFGGTVRLKRPDAAALTKVPLDFNGYRLGIAPVSADTISLRPDAPYLLIEK